MVSICLIYIDDIIIFSSTFQEHLHRLSLLFNRLRKANLKFKPSKCKFASHSVDFLGFVVSSDGISPNPDKIDAVRSFPVPTSVKELRSFLGLSNYYLRFVEGFSKIASPLNRLTLKDAVFSWSPECQSAFQTLKDCLCYPPILSYPDFAHPFHLFTDASQTAMGYVLGKFFDGKEHVIAYCGRELSHAETRYSTTEREALAVVDGIKRKAWFPLSRRVSQSVAECRRASQSDAIILLCNTLRPMETAALKYCNSLQQSATHVAEIEKVLSLQHSATLYDPGTIELIACCCYCTNITGKKMAAFNEESLAFLEEVRKYDCLYNKFNKDFKNKFKKYNC